MSEGTKMRAPNLTGTPPLPPVESLLPKKDIPKAAGWTVLVKIQEPKTKTAGGIELADVSIEAQEYMQICGTVVDMGPLCYTHPKFGDAGPWCKIGDDVLFYQNAGDGFWYDDIRYRFLNDDNIKGTIDDPEKLKVYVK